MRRRGREIAGGDCSAGGQAGTASGRDRDRGGDADLEHRPTAQDHRADRRAAYRGPADGRFE